ncbi:hypothetical protein QR680_008760 [Steinernema hermaphroditum]|uniref:Chitin-binding type-2 domain-containing protein n=1 Tax=Steinernema hermaphroditum TaxID=289476 RepID=A0AA39IK20_9BILA|nr:hypothetical protein QR680_008760 [Steinernema hermaphroditum]
MFHWVVAATLLGFATSLTLTRSDNATLEEESLERVDPFETPRILHAVRRTRALPEDLQRRWLTDLCVHRDAIQLGMCSATYVKCDRYVRKPEFHKCGLGKVFHNGVCEDVATLPHCKDFTLNAVNLETEQLAQRQDLCKHNPANSLFLAPHQCSRQGLVCDQNRQPLSFLCPLGQVLDPNFLSCVFDRHRCTRFPPAASTAVKQHLLQARCAQLSKQTSFVDPFGQVQVTTLMNYGSCDTWYLDCRPNFQALIQCGPGKIYDPQRRICRTPSAGDKCQMETSCAGYEWNILPAGRCKSEFVFCNGLRPKRFICDHGKVFHQGKCFPLEQSDCPICEFGDVKASTECRKYLQCSEDRNKRRVWKEFECPRGDGFSGSEKKCVPDYTCAKIEKCRSGSSYKFSCTDYMVCLNGEFEYRSCPHMTSWNVRTSQCEYDPECAAPGEGRSCRDGDVIPSTDCTTYQLCRNGKFTKKMCSSANDACAHCDDSDDRPDICKEQKDEYRYTDYKPVQCRHGDKFVNTERCSEYVECLEGVWYTRVCPSGFVFDSATAGCRSSLSETCDQNNTSLYVPPKTSEEEEEEEGTTEDHHGGLDEACDLRSPQKVEDLYDCTKYKVCNLRSGFYEDRNCEFGEQFDRRKGECVWGHQCNPEECTSGMKIPKAECGKLQLCMRGKWENYRCKGGAVFEDNQCSKTKLCKDYVDHPTSCMEGVTVEHSYDCSKFLLCFRGNIVEKQCVNGQKFNPEYGRCDFNYECKVDQVPPCYHGESRADPNECDKYELCQDNEFVRQSCPHGTVYKTDRMRCEPGSCTTNKIGDEEEETEGCKESPLPEGFKPNPTDCGRFFQCAKGSWTPKKCKAGLVFNPAIAICDWPRNVPGCD